MGPIVFSRGGRALGAANESGMIYAMSALGQKQTSRDAGRMSALPPKADIRSALAHVR